MKDQYRHICKIFFFKGPHSIFMGRWRMAFSTTFCLFAFTFSCQLKAQDITDSVDLSVYSTDDSTIGNDHQNKAGKFSHEGVVRSVPDTTVARMKKEKQFAYANDPAYWVREKKEYKKGFIDHVFDFLQSDAVRWIFWICVGALVIFVIYRIIVVNDLFIFNSAKRKKKDLEDATNSEVDPLVIDQQIQEAIDQKKYNVAVRYLYIKTLHALNEKKWIQFHAQATNSEYLNQMSQHKMNKEFRFLTRAYEYMWYGKFEITEQQFALVHDNFKNFQAVI